MSAIKGFKRVKSKSMGVEFTEEKATIRLMNLIIMIS